MLKSSFHHAKHLTKLLEHIHGKDLKLCNIVIE